MEGVLQRLACLVLEYCLFSRTIVGSCSPNLKQMCRGKISKVLIYTTFLPMWPCSGVQKWQTGIFYRWSTSTCLVNNLIVECDNDCSIRKGDVHGNNSDDMSMDPGWVPRSSSS